VLPGLILCYGVLPGVTVYCTVLQCVAVRCSVLQCVPMYPSTKGTYICEKRHTKETNIPHETLFENKRVSTPSLETSRCRIIRWWYKLKCSVIRS